MKNKEGISKHCSQYFHLLVSVAVATTLYLSIFRARHLILRCTRASVLNENKKNVFLQLVFGVPLGKDSQVKRQDMYPEIWSVVDVSFTPFVLFGSIIENMFCLIWLNRACFHEYLTTFVLEDMILLTICSIKICVRNIAILRENDTSSWFKSCWSWKCCALHYNCSSSGWNPLQKYVILPIRTQIEDKFISHLIVYPSAPITRNTCYIGAICRFSPRLLPPLSS